MLRAEPSPETLQQEIVTFVLRSWHSKW